MKPNSDTEGSTDMDRQAPRAGSQEIIVTSVIIIIIFSLMIKIIFF